MIETPRQAIALLRKGKVLTLTPCKKAQTPVRSLVEEIVGGPIRGSWWAHPRAETIFLIASELEDRTDVLVAKLVEGRVTFVHRTLWPDVLAVVTHRRWRQAAIRTLSASGRRLLEKVQRTPRVRVDLLGRTPAERKRNQNAAKELGAAMLVHGEQIHTESGRHATVLRSWGRWAAASGAQKRGLQMRDAQQHLTRLCGPHHTLAE